MEEQIVREIGIPVAVSVFISITCSWVLYTIYRIVKGLLDRSYNRK